MKATYNEILNSMKTTFFNECGENVDMLSDMGARFQAVASELFSISCYGDHILNQAFPQTASGEYLDYHAQLRGLQRKQATKTTGHVIFSIEAPVENDTEILAGTICAVKDSPYIQFSTDSTQVIPAGGTKVSVPVTAISPGYDHNVPAHSVTVMVNPPIGVTAVDNPYAFSGGYDGESDESLKNRIIDDYRIPNQNLNIGMLENAVLGIDEVLDCKICVVQSSYITMYVKIKGEVVTSELINKVRNTLAILDILNIHVNVYTAQKKDYKLYVDVKASKELKDDVEKAVREYATSFRIGENVATYKFVGVVSGIDGVDYCIVNSDQANGGMIACANDEYLVLEDVEVNYIE